MFKSVTYGTNGRNGTAQLSQYKHKRYIMSVHLFYVRIPSNSVLIWGIGDTISKSPLIILKPRSTEFTFRLKIKKTTSPDILRTQPSSLTLRGRKGAGTCRSLS